MGIYDRDYYRREGPSFLGSFAERGAMCKWLIGINVAAFILQLVTRPPGFEGQVDLGPFSNTFILSPEGVLHGKIWQLISYAFLHSVNDFGHILWNMLFLYWFGVEMEELYGPREFLSIYLVSAFVGGLAHVLLYLAGWGQAANPVLGASGEVTTMLVLCAFHYPTRIIYLFFFLPIPIWFFVVFAVGKDFISFMGQREGNVAVDVHLAGALFAVLYYKGHWKLMSVWPDLQAWRKRRSQPRLRVFHPDGDATREPVGAAVAAPSFEDEQLEAKVDAILEKISRSGKESLTENEKQLLLKASERIKRRRQ